MTERAKIGMVFDRTFPGSTVTEFARRLEAGGVDEMWFIEDCFFTTAPPLAAAALAVTERLTVGLGILPAVARTAAMTAMEIATLSSIAPGRVIGGVGHGIQYWMGQMGVRPKSPVTTLDETLVAVRRLLAGETVTVDGTTVHLDDVSLEHVPTPTPPVLAGVRGPRSMALAGRVSDGLVLAGPCPAAYVTWAVETAASPRPDFAVVTFTNFCVTEDAATAHATMAPWLIQVLGTDEDTALRLLPFYDDLIERAGHGPDALAGMPREQWVTIGAIGTLDDAAEHVAAVEAAGATGIAFFPATDLEVARRQVDDVIALTTRS